MLDIQELESKLTDLKYSVKNGKISGNAKGHDDLEHPLLQMMQQFVENGKQPDVRTEPVYPTFSTVTLLTVTFASSSVWTAVRQ